MFYEKGTYKVFFDVSATREDAEAIIHKHDELAEIHNFYSKREIGCNVLTFAVITSTLDKVRIIERDTGVTKVELIYSLYNNSVKSCCVETKC